MFTRVLTVTRRPSASTTFCCCKSLKRGLRRKWAQRVTGYDKRRKDAVAVCRSRSNSLADDARYAIYFVRRRQLSLVRGFALRCDTDLLNSRGSRGINKKLGGCTCFPTNISGDYRKTPPIDLRPVCCVSPLSFAV